MKTFSSADLIDFAIEARKNACAEFSNFKVGAIVLTTEGKIYKGCNIESSSYGLTICAERVALANALSDGQTQINTVVVVADTERPVSPCGACRQLMVDYAPNANVVLSNLNKDIKKTTVQELLPYNFNRGDLNEK